MQRKKVSLCIADGMLNGRAGCENDMAIPQKSKHRITF